MSASMVAGYERVFDRQSIIESIRYRACRKSAREFCGVLTAMAEHLQTIRSNVAKEWSIDVPKESSKQEEAIANELVKLTFCRDAINGLSLDYEEHVAVADSDDQLLNSEFEQVLWGVKHRMRNELAVHCGTNEE